MAAGRYIEGDQSLGIGWRYFHEFAVYPDAPAGKVEGQVAGAEGKGRFHQQPGAVKAVLGL